MKVLTTITNAFLNTDGLPVLPKAQPSVCQLAVPVMDTKTVIMQVTREAFAVSYLLAHQFGVFSLFIHLFSFADSTATCGNATNCLHGCYKTPTGPVCSCPIGFRASGTSCADIDECSASPPLCSQDCSNTDGGYQCTCVPGYKLHMDNHSCIAFGKLKFTILQFNFQFSNFPI